MFGKTESLETEGNASPGSVQRIKLLNITHVVSCLSHLDRKQSERMTKFLGVPDFFLAEGPDFVESLLKVTTNPRWVI